MNRAVANLILTTWDAMTGEKTETLGVLESVVRQPYPRPAFA